MDFAFQSCYICTCSCTCICKWVKMDENTRENVRNHTEKSFSIEVIRINYTNRSFKKVMHQICPVNLEPSRFRFSKPCSQYVSLKSRFNCKMSTRTNNRISVLSCFLHLSDQNQLHESRFKKVVQKKCNCKCINWPHWIASSILSVFCPLVFTSALGCVANFFPI